MKSHHTFAFLDLLANRGQACVHWTVSPLKTVHQSSAGTRSTHSEGGHRTCSHAPFSKPLYLNGRLSCRSKVAGQYSKSPMPMDSSSI